jgi:hypothetical protein
MFVTFGQQNECPTGLITQEAFHNIFSKFFPLGGTFVGLFLERLQQRHKDYVLGEHSDEKRFKESCRVKILSD